MELSVPCINKPVFAICAASGCISAAVPPLTLKSYNKGEMYMNVTWTTHWKRLVLNMTFSLLSQLEDEL